MSASARKTQREEPRGVETKPPEAQTQTKGWKTDRRTVDLECDGADEIIHVMLRVRNIEKDVDVTGSGVCYNTWSSTSREVLIV